MVGAMMQAGQRARRVDDVRAGGVFAERDIANVVDAVLDRPVSAPLAIQDG